ncbi:hypothetical protein QBC39DRAFT_267803 [Podospora conica]|nr:hypothetical protein QBC39DRAFT_267803 [Schizothecium conicum]
MGRSGDTRLGEARHQPSPDTRWRTAGPTGSTGTAGTAGTTRQPVRTLPQPKQSSRLPQTMHQRRPSAGEPGQLHLNHQPQSWDSTGSGSSGFSGVKTTITSGAVPSKLASPSSKQRNVLRRKQSGLSQDLSNRPKESLPAANRRSSSSSHPRSQTSLDATSTGLHFDRDRMYTPTEMRGAHETEGPKTAAHAMTIYPELDRYRDMEPLARPASPGYDMPYKIGTYDLPPPTPFRDTTPTSISSQSPGLVAPMRIPTAGGRMRLADSPLTRPPVTRRRADSIPNEDASISADPRGLAAVRESLTSSSSNSTVRDGDKQDKKKKKRLSPLPPSPPPRKSSHKATGSRDEEKSPFKASREPAQPSLTSPPKAKATAYSLPRYTAANQPAAASKTPPARPSRDGTPDLQSQLGLAIPVIQSNLSSSSLHVRRPSDPLSTAPVGRPIFSPSGPERQAQVLRRPAPPSRSATSTDTTTASKTKSDSGRATRTPSPSVSAFKSRFPIFGRRTKPTPEATQEKEKDKSTRKGPAAGTGHEGYGRLGSVRRKSSTIPTAGRSIPGTMSSQESLGSNNSNKSSYDPFFTDRMAPVVIAGGEIIENRNTSTDLNRTESNQSMHLRRPSADSKASSKVSLASREGVRNTLWPSPFPRDSIQTMSTNSRRPSDSSDHESLAMKSTLAFRRSVQRTQTGDQDTARVPRPIVTRAQTMSPSMTSLDASIMSDDSYLEPPADKSGSGPKKLLRRARSPMKWNFFGRSHSQPATDAKKKDTKAVAAAVKVVPAKPAASKPVAFYTMIDSSEQEDGESPDLEEVLREARGLVTPPAEPRIGSVMAKKPAVTQGHARQGSAASSIGETRPTLAAKRTVTSPAILPAPSVSRVAAPAAPIPQKTQVQQPPVRQATGRPSRLAQVGRIPKVVSARPEHTSPKSFSRPFHRLSTPMPLLSADGRHPEFVAKGPSPTKPSTPELTLDESATTSASNLSTTHSLPSEPSPEPTLQASEFFSFPPRKNSQGTTTSTSSCSGGIYAFADATAVVPDPTSPLAEDEIWDEYNDLLGDESMRLSRRSSRKKPVPLMVQRLARVEPCLESPTVVPPTPSQSLAQVLMPEKQYPTSSIYSVDMVEQIAQTLGSMVPTPQPLQPQQPAVMVQINRGEKKTTPSQRGSGSSVKQTRYSSSSGTSLGSEDSSPVSQVNLRVGSMTVSKWLTFGHVLFSPVRDELIADVGSLKRPSILVVDGLGNDDWSFYAAETYPAATFFNLSPRAPLPAADRRNSTAFPLSPPNHHQIQYVSHSDKFPFGSESFTAVVFRFPAAGPEVQYRNIIAEARRVLKPGGFIELSILDVDLNNMGNRGRRAVRRLKERVHARAPDTYLGSTSDLVLRLMGRRGFADIKTCRVGVPVAATPIAPKSSETKAPSMPGGGRDNRSLPEMIMSSDESSPVADESITKMVAKVGRWWYTSCYENAAGGPSRGGGGLWGDKPLVAECQEWGTSLKLMVCHARVPDGRAARVASI